MFLLMDNSKNTKEAMFRPYSERFMLFEYYGDALAVAIERGWDDGWGMFKGKCPAVGSMQHINQGDIDLSIIGMADPMPSSRLDNEESIT